MGKGSGIPGECGDRYLTLCPGMQRLPVASTFHCWDSVVPVLSTSLDHEGMVFASMERPTTGSKIGSSRWQGSETADITSTKVP